MIHYKLQPTEVVLYEIDTVQLKGEKNSTSLTLTNLHFVFETTVKKLLTKSYTTTECFTIDTVKFYNNAPQVKQNGEEVVIYFTDTERYITFPSKKEAHRFTAKALEFLTGKTAFIRGIDKAKDTVAAVDEALGIDSVGIATKVAKGAVKAAATTTVGGKWKTTKAIVNFANGIIHTKETQQIAETSSVDDKLNTLTKLKGLLDDGTITQAEFDEKKKELLS